MPSYKDEKTGKWYCQFYYKDWTGKNRHKVKRGFIKKRDADAWENNFKNKEQASDITLGFLVEEFKQHLKIQLELKVIKQKTYRSKISNMINNILPYFPDTILVKNIAIKDINAWLLKLKNKKSRTHPTKTLASSTILQTKSLLSNIFDFAIANFGLKFNPTKASEKIKYSSNDERAHMWTLEEYAKFYSHLNNEKFKLIFNIIFFAGSRIGEVLALTPSQISHDELAIKFTYNSDTDSLEEPKTKSSVRTINIPEFLYIQIQSYISKLYNIKDNERIFDLKYGQVYYKLVTSYKILNLPKISPHNLRHSYASIFYSASKDITAVSAQLGHSNPKITLQIYTHMIPKENKLAVKKYENIIKDSKLLSLEPPTIEIEKN